MTRDQADQVARIIYNIFEFEETIDPRTVAQVFVYIGRLTNEYNESGSNSEETDNA